MEKLSAKDLIKVWSAPDSSHLMAKQWSIRLPILVAAKISALSEMYPNKSRSELISELLSTAIEELYGALPSYSGEQADIDPETGEEYFYERGQKETFRQLTNRFAKEYEKEAGLDEQKPPYSSTYVVTKE